MKNLLILYCFIFFVITIKAGSIVSWGKDNQGVVTNVPSGNDFIAIDGGVEHSIALKNDGSIVAWG